MKYDCVMVFHKMTTLTDYFVANQHKLVGHLDTSFPSHRERYQRIAERYLKEQPVRLLLLVRYEYNPQTRKNNVFCRIRCPINPLPVEDEFKTPSVNALKSFLTQHGWTETEVIPAHMLD